MATAEGLQKTKINELLQTLELNTENAIQDLAINLPPQGFVKVSGTPQDGQTAVYDAGSGTWVPGEATGGGGLDAEAVQDTVAAMLTAGTGVTLSYDDGAGTLTITATAGGGSTDPEIVRDVVGAALVAGTGVSVTVDDAGDTITVAVSGLGVSDVTGLQDALDGKQPAGSYAPATHTHDDRYYTETEADGRFVRTVNNTGPDANGNVTVEGGTGGTTDHGALSGLGDDDHPQYALTDGSRGSFASMFHSHDYVPLGRTVNGKALTGNITLSAGDVGAAASSHNHPISGVTGLQTALDGKAASSHTHGVSDLTATGTPSATTYLRGDGAWATPEGGGGGATPMTYGQTSGAFTFGVTPNGDRFAWGANSTKIATGQVTLNANTAYMFPLALASRVPFKGYGLQVKVAGNGAAEISVALYAIQADGSLGARITPVWTVSATGAGFKKTSALTQVNLEPGLYAVVLISSGWSSTPPAIAGSGDVSRHLMSVSLDGNANPGFGLSAPGVSSLPSTWATPPTAVVTEAPILAVIF